MTLSRPFKTKSTHGIINTRKFPSNKTTKPARKKKEKKKSKVGKPALFCMCKSKSISSFLQNYNQAEGSQCLILTIQPSPSQVVMCGLHFVSQLQKNTDTHP